jgi:copper(I)-binding protein
MKRFIGALALLSIANAAPAVEIHVNNPWVRSAAQGQAATPTYVDIVSDTELKLVGATSPWARKVELRVVEMKDGVPMARTVDALDMPVGTLRIAPGGEQLVLIDAERARQRRLGPDHAQLRRRAQHGAHGRLESTGARLSLPTSAAPASD